MKHTALVLLSCCLLAETAPAKDGPLPVKIYIVAGQSNAEPRGSIEFLKANCPELAKQRDDLWRFRPVVQTPTPFLGPNYGAYGVELGAGLAVADAVDNDVIFVTSAVGGTMLFNRWRPPSAVKRMGGEIGDLYDTMIKHVHNLVANLDQLYPRYRGQGYELAGFIWFQGENDCCAKTQGYYRDLLMDLINDVRAELGVPKLPVVIVKINDGCWGPPAIDIWAANEYAAHADENTVVVNTRDLRSLCHYDSQSYMTIGQRIGKALLPFCKKTVHVGDAEVRAAARKYFARTAGKSGTPDMADLKQGLVGYWKFDEEQGYGISSALEGGASGRCWFGPPGPVRVDGKFGGAIKLIQKQKIEFPDYRDPVNAEGEIEQLSIAFWARTTGGGSEYRIGKGVGQKLEPFTGHNWYWSRHANKAGWDLRGFDYGNLSLTGNVKVDGTSQTYGAWTTPGFGGDGVEWRHLVIAYDGPKKEVRFYTDGQLRRIRRSTIVKPRPNKPKDAPPDPISVEPGPLLTANAPLTIGDVELVNKDFDFQVYDELAIWSRALSEEEVTKLYNGGAGAEITLANPLTAKSLPELEEIVRNNIDAEVRYQAVTAVATKGEAGVPLLLEAARDRSGGVRYGAAQALGKKGREMLPRALTMLKDRDQDVRVMGTVILKHMAKKANPAATVPALCAALRDDHFDVRMGAAEALASWGDWAEAAVPALLKATSDEEWWVRDSVYMALTNICTPKARLQMIDVMTDERHSAIWFQACTKILEPIAKDPALRDKLALAYAEWLQKGKGWTAPFAARGKFNQGLRGLERYAKESIPIPAPVGEVIRKILKDEIAPLWPVDDKAREKLEAILEKIEQQKEEEK